MLQNNGNHYQAYKTIGRHDGRKKKLWQSLIRSVEVSKSNWWCFRAWPSNALKQLVHRGSHRNSGVSYRRTSLPGLPHHPLESRLHMGYMFSWLLNSTFPLKDNQTSLFHAPPYSNSGDWLQVTSVATPSCHSPWVAFFFNASWTVL